MHVREAGMAGACKRPEGTQALEWNSVCPDAGFERLNLVRGECRVCVALDRPEQGALRRFQVMMETEGSPQPGEKVAVEFFHPGEQAGARPQNAATPAHGDALSRGTVSCV